MVGSREYPARPIVGAGAVVHRGVKVLLIRRRYPPNEGKWAIPGGLVEVGETAERAAEREVLEETGVRVKVEGLIDVVSDVHLDEGGKVKFHFVLVDYLARAKTSKVVLNHESSEFGWFPLSEITRLEMSEGTRRVVTKGLSAMKRARRLR